MANIKWFVFERFWSLTESHAQKRFSYKKRKTTRWNKLKSKTRLRMTPSTQYPSTMTTKLILCFILLCLLWRLKVRCRMSLEYVIWECRKEDVTIQPAPSHWLQEVEQQDHFVNWNSPRREDNVRRVTIDRQSSPRIRWIYDKRQCEEMPSRLSFCESITASCSATDNWTTAAFQLERSARRERKNIWRVAKATHSMLRWQRSPQGINPMTTNDTA